MERNKPLLLIPDAINCGISKEFTQVPNEILRNPEISGKAKSILCILLSNRDGWKSHQSQIQKFMKEQNDAIQSGLKELEQAGYLLRIRYRDKTTKVLKGSFWAYTDIPNTFNFEIHLNIISQNNYEIVEPNNPRYCFPRMEKPRLDYPDVENPTLIILNNNNTKNNNTKSSLVDADKKYISPNLFENFWSLYPKKVGKGAALSSWLKICTRTNHEKPTWDQIRHAVRNQSKSDQWQNPKFIPHASTWLNQFRWLDDATLLKSDYRESNKPKTIKGPGGDTYTLAPDGFYYFEGRRLMD